MTQVTRSVAMYVGFPVVYALSTVAGRATRLAGGEVALVWPAAAVAVIWLITARPGSWRERAIHVSMLAVVTLAMNILTGAAPALAAWFVLVNVTLAVVTVEVLTYRRDEVVLRDPADLARLVAAVAAGSCCAAVLATAFMTTVTGAPVWATFALFAVRNGTTALIGVSVWLQFRAATWRRPHLSPFAIAETLLVGTVVIVVYIGIFWLNTGVPMAFLTLVPAMWVALRYSTTVSTVFLTLAGAWIIFATLSNKGVFIVQNMQERALLAQAMVCSLTLIVLALSLYRDSRARLIAQLETARDQADQDSELLGAVLDSIHDSVILVDPAKGVVLQNARADDSGLVHQVVAASGRDDATVEDDTLRTRRRDVVVAAGDSRVVELTTAPLPRQSQFTVMAFRDVTEERENARALRDARDLFAGVLEAASEQAIIGTDPSGHITVFNTGAERLLGWTREEMLGRTPMDFHYYPEVCARAQALGIPPGFDVFVSGVGPDRAEISEWTYVRRDGSHASVSLAVSQMTDEDGACVGYIKVATDITERKATERALAESEERFRLAFDTAPMGMFMFEVMPQRSGRITRCNQAMGDLLGREPADVLGMTVTGLGADESTSATTGLRQLLALRIGQLFEAEMAFQRADGDTVWGAVSASIVAPQGSNPYGIGLVEDITARRRVEAELQHLALHDPLTGLANRALVTDRIEHALALAERGESGRVGLIFLDLDGFKAVNDTWGHAQGDEVLETVARRIQASIRPGDTAARLGGDEFAVLCPKTGDVDQLTGVADRIRAELHRPVTLADGGTYDQLSVSAGVVVSHPGCTAETLLQRADKLMYQAKRSGKDCVTGADAAEEAAVMRAVQLMAEMDRALDLHEFVVYVQPIVDLRTGGCVAGEALLRWDHPDWGLLTPDQFLDVAEATRYMPAIGRHVLVEACRQASGWTGPMADASVHVNVSGRQLEVGDFYADVHDALAGTGLPPDRLVLEMTETYAGLVANSTKADLDRLRTKGVRIAIDDVGTGFSGLAKIVDLPIDILKIDKQFIAGLPQDSRCEAITKAILSLGSSLGLTVIAEGIETRDQHDLLVSWGCAFGQGFLYGRPVSEAQLSADTTHALDLPDRAVGSP